MTNQSETQAENKDLLVVFLNPVAGLVDPKRTSKRIEEWCRRSGWRCEIYETQEGEDLRPRVAEACRLGCSVIAAAGGDGTISSVAAGLVFSQVPLLILPLGTGNLLARDLGIPGDLNRALALVEKDHQVLQLDVMEINQHYSVLNAGVGFSSILIKNTPREEKRRLGFLAYIKSAVRALFGLQPHRFRLAIDGQKLRLQASEVYIANGGLLGIQLPFKDLKIIPGDGLVDVFVIKARTLRDYLEILYYIIRRKPRQAPKMSYIQARESIQIECDHPLPVQSDGEVIGETPVTIKVIPSAVQVYLPVKTNDDLVNRLRSLVGLKTAADENQNPG